MPISSDFTFLILKATRKGLGSSLGTGIMKKIEFILFDTYLETIKKSVGTKMFQNIYALVDGEKKDVAENGTYSCANFASSVLIMFSLVKSRHATVKSTIKDMENSGWVKIDKPREGTVIIWEPWEQSDRQHIGFYIGNDIAISTDSENGGIPNKHHWTYAGKRPVQAVYWLKSLDPVRGRTRGKGTSAEDQGVTTPKGVEK